MRRSTVANLMRILGAALAAAPAACSLPPPREPTLEEAQLRAAEAVIDAFYSFDSARLRAAMSSAPKSIPVIVYYQGWAQGGNYRVLTRKPCRFEKADEVRCDITVRDDLIPALRTGFDVTDTFHLSFTDRAPVAVWTSSNDPPEFKLALDWVRAKRLELFTTGVCRDFFAGGPTPKECVRAVVKGFADFTASRRR